MRLGKLAVLIRSNLQDREAWEQMVEVRAQDQKHQAVVLHRAVVLLLLGHPSDA
jgi:hypothetical protein